jgi:hypothetical protein
MEFIMGSFQINNTTCSEEQLLELVKIQCMIALTMCKQRIVAKELTCWLSWWHFQATYV